MNSPFFDFTGQVTSIILDPPEADEITSCEGDILEAEPSPEKHSLVVTTENHARDLTTNNHSSMSCFTKTPTENDKETCSSENDQQVVFSDTSASKGSSVKNVASSSLDSGNDRSDMYEEQKRISEDKHITAGAKDQEDESTKIARCKLPFENSTIFIASIVTR